MLLSFLPFLWFYAHFLPVPLHCMVGGFTLVVEVGSVTMSNWSPSPGGTWCSCWWLLLPPSRIYLGSFLDICWYAFTPLLILHWSAAPHYIWICYIRCLLSVEDTISLLSLLPLKLAVPSSRSTFLWLTMFIAVGSPVPSLCPILCLHSSTLHPVSLLL